MQAYADIYHAVSFCEFTYTLSFNNLSQFVLLGRYMNAL